MNSQFQTLNYEYFLHPIKLPDFTVLRRNKTKKNKRYHTYCTAPNSNKIGNIDETEAISILLKDKCMTSHVDQLS